MDARSEMKTFYPGPTWVAPQVREAMAAQALNHRSPEFRALFSELQTRLRRTLACQGPVLLITASATGVMEGLVRNTVRERALNLANGAFGERWHAITSACDKPADLLAFPWGEGVRPERVRQALRSRPYDVVTLVHNETSTGVVNPLAELASVLREFPETLFLVDCVTSLYGVAIDIGGLGLDAAFCGTQKCLALPPGFSVLAVSTRTLERARAMQGRGVYFDLVALSEAAADNETPNTPSTSHLQALRVQLERIEAEGLATRFKRHRAMADRVRAWAQEHFALFAEDGFRSDTVTCISNRGAIATERLVAGLKERGYIISDGYGALKGKTFRIGHMGDLELADIEDLLAVADDVLAGLS